MNRQRRKRKKMKDYIITIQTDRDFETMMKAVEKLKIKYLEPTAKIVSIIEGA